MFSFEGAVFADFTNLLESLGEQLLQSTLTDIHTQSLPDTVDCVTFELFFDFKLNVLKDPCLQSKKSLEYIDSLDRFLWEHLHDLHWKDVNLLYRELYGLTSVASAMRKLFAMRTSSTMGCEERSTAPASVRSGQQQQQPEISSTMSLIVLLSSFGQPNRDVFKSVYRKLDTG